MSMQQWQGPAVERGIEWYSYTYPDGVRVYAKPVGRKTYNLRWIATDRYETLGDNQSEVHHLSYPDDNFILEKICNRQGCEYEYDSEFDDTEITATNVDRKTAADMLHQAIVAVKAYLRTPVEHATDGHRSPSAI